MKLASCSEPVGWALVKWKILGLVLAGGKSKRFGEDKASYAFHDGIRQLDYAARLLDAFCVKVAVSVSGVQPRAFEKEGVVYDLIKDRAGIEGPTGGVLSGLAEAQGMGLFVIACDMPLLDASLLLRLLTQRDESRLATCYLASDGKPEPLCAIYEPLCLPALERHVASCHSSLRRFLMDENVAMVPCRSPELLASLNTREDVERLQSIVSS